MYMERVGSIDHDLLFWCLRLSSLGNAVEAVDQQEEEEEEE